MKKIPVKSILSVGLSLVIVVGILLVLFTASDGSTLETPTTETITPIEVTIDNSHEDALVKAAENDRYVLYANLKTAVIRLEDKHSGAVWDSAPQGYDTDENIKGAAKLSLGSLLNFQYADRDSNTTTQNSVAGCVQRENLNARLIGDGVRFDFYFEREGFLIPLEVTLTEEGIRAAVPLADIQEQSSAVKLTTISPLPNFGAGREGEEGYFLLPDGSGALVSFEQSSTGFSGRVYGEDLAIVSKTKTAPDTRVMLPVFGARLGDQAMLAIITKGDARARVQATMASTKSPYCTVGATFIYRESILVDVSQKTFETTQVNMFEEAPCGLEEFAVEYRPVEQADYVGMANAYRSYLLQEKGMTPLENQASPLTVQLIGGVMRQDNVLGIPVQRVTPVTTYADAAEIANTLRAGGVTDLTLNYLDWYKGADRSRLTVDMAAESRLGGGSGLKKLLEQMQEQGTDVFLDLNLTDMMQGQWGYSTKYDAAQTVQKEPAIQYTYLMSTFQVDATAPLKFLLSPALLGRAAGQVSAKLDKFSPAGYSVRSLGQKIYSDFGDRAVDRGVGLSQWEQVLGSLSEKNAGMFAAANAYAFPYASAILDAPLTSGRYLLESRSVPFYTIALHGLVPMSGTSINAAEDSRIAYLQALEAGVGIQYTLGMRNVDLAAEAGSEYGYCTASLWMDEAAANWNEAADYLRQVSDQAVASHEQLSAGVYRTVFANGLGVIVNYTDADAAADGQTIPAKGFVPIGW